MINKYAEINDRILLYNACKGILRVKQSQYYTEKRAFPVAQVVGGTAGAGIGGYGGYKLGDILAKRWNLDPNSWKARALRYGGAYYGGATGALLGALAPTFLMPSGAAAGSLGFTAGTGAGLTAGAGAASTAATAAGTAANAARAVNVGSKVLKGLNTASNISTAVDTAKNLAKVTSSAVAPTV